MTTHSLPPEFVGKRLDATLAKMFPVYSRGDLARAVTAGEILYNGAPTRPAQRIALPAAVTMPDTITTALPTMLVADDTIALDIIAKEDDFIVINKPAGLQVHPSATQHTGTLANALVAHFPTITGVGEDPFRPGIVHRLDKDTSGLLLVATSQQGFLTLKNLFQNRKIKKTYQALVHGTPPKDGVIDLPLAKSRSHNKQCVAEGRYAGTPREAMTRFSTISKGLLPSGEPCAHITAQPLTGRTHQIRVHLAHEGYPLIGDKLYTPKKMPTLTTDKHDRFYLHASELVFSFNNLEYLFTAPLPPYFTKALTAIKKSDS